MNKRYQTAAIVLVVLAILFGSFMILPKVFKGNTHLNVRGGKEFFGSQNVEMTEFNDSQGYTFKVVDDKNTCNSLGNWEDVDIVQAGTLNCRNEISQLIKDGKIAATYTVYNEIPLSTSPIVLSIKFNKDQDLYTPLLEAGFIYVKDGSVCIKADKLKILVDATIENKKFRDIGIDADGFVNIGFPKSTVGVPSADVLLSCRFNNCEEMIGSEAILPIVVDGKDTYTLKPEYATALIALYERSGKLIDSSVEYCFNWLNTSNDTVRISIFTESCFASWAKKNAHKPDLIEEAGNVIVYMEDNTLKNTFTLIAVSEKGKAYLDAMQNNDLFYETVVTSTGMRSSGSVTLAPTQYSKYISEREFYTLIGFPFIEVTTATRYVLDNYAK